jgi:hypothetical protein
MTDFSGHQAKPGLRVQIIASVIGKYNGNLDAAAVVERKSPAQKWMMDMNHIHRLEEFPVFGLVAQGEIIAGIRQSQARAANDTRFLILVFKIAKGEHIHLVPFIFEGALIQVNIICYSTHIRLIGVRHHSDTHGDMLRQADESVKDKAGIATAKWEENGKFTRVRL